MLIYKTTNLVNGKIYIGKDTHNNPKYIGSGRLLKRAIKKHGKSRFHKEILEHCFSLSQLNAREIYWINALNSLAPNGYNLTTGGDGGDTRVGYSKAQKKQWLRKKSLAQTGKQGYWKGKKRPKQSAWLKAAHKNGMYGKYEWVRKPRVAKNVEKLGWPVGKTRTKVKCSNCGLMISNNNLSSHQRGNKCR